MHYVINNLVFPLELAMSILKATNRFSREEILKFVDDPIEKEFVFDAYFNAKPITVEEVLKIEKNNLRFQAIAMLGVEQFINIVETRKTQEEHHRMWLMTNTINEEGLIEGLLTSEHVSFTEYVLIFPITDIRKDYVTIIEYEAINKVFYKTIRTSPWSYPKDDQQSPLDRLANSIELPTPFHNIKNIFLQGELTTFVCKRPEIVMSSRLTKEQFLDTVTIIQ